MPEIAVWVNCLYSKEFFDKGPIRTYDARLC